MARVTLAYEPVWAIGTGRGGHPEQAQEAHAAVRGHGAGAWAAEVADTDAHPLRRLGQAGQCRRTCWSRPDIDGALVGGASLKADEFSAIVQAGESVVK
jgi:triosephosphate isomerase